MITLAEDNSRMKDFFDVYRLLTFHEVDKAILSDAINATFENRQTAVSRNHILFSEGFSSDSKRIAAWKSFLKRIKWKQDLPFDMVMLSIRENLQPYYDALLSEN